MRKVARGFAFWALLVPTLLVIGINALAWLAGSHLYTPLLFKPYAGRIPEGVIVIAKGIFVIWILPALAFLLVGWLVIAIAPLFATPLFEILDDKFDGRPGKRVPVQPASTATAQARREQTGVLCAALMVPVSAGGALVAYARHFVEAHNFAISLAGVTVLLMFTVRPRVYQLQTWKLLTDPWLKWSGVATISIGGFRLISSNDALQSKLLNIAMAKSQLSPELFASAHSVVVFITGLAVLLTLIGRVSSQNVESKDPSYWFVPAFLCVWLSAVGNFTLFFDGTLLTFLASRG